eukprot:3543804-Prymnesium_polylepis.1
MASFPLAVAAPPQWFELRRLSVYRLIALHPSRRAAVLAGIAAYVKRVRPGGSFRWHSNHAVSSCNCSRWPWLHPAAH